mmetsp:Transcript_18899/g.43926  ORF Transcript_18899/g.43926 Transcript_18899/m.43926 type:complete len:805 (-) Transcript_18899:117-2531(-)
MGEDSAQEPEEAAEEEAEEQQEATEVAEAAAADAEEPAAGEAAPEAAAEEAAEGAADPQQGEAEPEEAGAVAEESPEAGEEAAPADDQEEGEEPRGDDGEPGEAVAGEQTGEATQEADAQSNESDNEEGIMVRDLPRDCKEWKSETMEQTHQEVGNFTVTNSRPLMQVMITRQRHHFGKSCKFSDSGENLQNCRPQKDPNFALQRKELDVGVQAVKERRESSCQTTWYRPVNKSTQYSSSDFLQSDQDQSYDKVDELTSFLSAVSVGVEEALQTNETVDIFQEEFSHLGEEESGAISKTNSSIKEFRNFYDVQYTKGKRIEWVEWVPHSQDMLASSCCDSAPFSERLESSGKASVSSVLLWSFQDSLQPHAILLSPFEVPVFKFYPSNEHFIIGGVSSGQMLVWKLSDADLGHARREKNKGAADEEKNSTAIVQHKIISVIDESHKRPVLGMEFLPAPLEIERRGRTASEKNPKDGPIKYVLTIGCDGQVMIWDLLAMLEAMNDHDFVWKPVHRIQLNRQDSGTEMGCCQVLYCHDRFDEKGQKCLTNFYASTEEGELVFGDWAARVEEDRKPEFVKRLSHVSKTYRPMLSLERSPFFPDVILGVTDWAFYLWKDGLKEHLFQSSYCTAYDKYFARGVWSPTRPSVIFLGLVSGGIDIWDFSDQSHKASLSDAGGLSMAISSMSFLRHGDFHNDQKLAVGDAQGHLHVHSIPKNLVRQAGKEFQTMQKFLEREEQRVKYFEQRLVDLADLKEQMEKQAQMQADREAAEAEKKATVDEEKVDAAAEEAYKKLEAECLEQLGDKRF